MRFCKKTFYANNWFICKQILLTINVCLQNKASIYKIFIPRTTCNSLLLKHLQYFNDDFLCCSREEIVDYITTSGTLADPVTFGCITGWCISINGGLYS